MAITTLPADLAAKINRTASLSHIDTVEELELGDGYSQSIEQGLNPIREQWELTFAPLDSIKLGLMRSFRALVRSSATFYWTAPGDLSPKAWKIKKDTYKEVFVSKITKKVTFTITQQFEP